MIDPVWELYRLAHRLTGGAATLLEWDAKIPEFPVVHAEVLKAKQFMGRAAAPAAPAPAHGAGGRRRDGAPPAVVHRPRRGVAMHDLGQIRRWMQAVVMHPAGAEEGAASEEARQEIDLPPEEAEHSSRARAP